MRRPKYPLRWMCGSPDRSGKAKYTHLIRHADDPNETIVRGRATHDPFRWKALKKAGVDVSRKALVELLGDGTPRTFNRIAVELTGQTADVLFESDLDTALWQLVDERLLEWTADAPILFRLC